MPRPSSGDAARRLIALLGQLTPELSVSVADLAQTLGIDAEQLADDLSTLCLCGIAPYTPDQMVDVFVEDGMVEVLSPLPAVTAPVRLSPAEAEALASALAAAGFTAEDPLAAKVLAAASAGFDADALERTLRSALATHDSTTFETLAVAVSEHEVVAIAYQSDGAAQPSARDVEPRRLFAERGAWYLSAWCRRAGGMRTFRVDRIRTAETTGEHFEPAAGEDSAPLPSAFAPEGLPLATLRFTPGEAFVEREWPGGRIAEAGEDGATVAEVPYAGTDWIARRVLARLGKVEALAPAEVRFAVREMAAHEHGRRLG
jgi:proteasome accessory factor C